MNFLRKVLEHSEHPICRTRLDGIYMVAGFAWFAALALAGWIIDYNIWSRWGLYIPQYEIDTSFFRFGVAPGMIGWLCTAGGAFIFASELVKFISTDLVLTNKRLLYKSGLIKIKLDATDVGDILGAHVDQGWLGQFFGYGKLHLDCRFIDDVYIPYVKNPYGVIRTLQKVRGDHANGEGAHQHPKSTPPQGAGSQTLINISGTGPVYIVDKVPADDRTPLQKLPKSLGDNMLNAFRRKA